MAGQPTTTLTTGTQVKRALISAYHPERVVPLVFGLHKLGVELWATDGTKAYLEKQPELIAEKVQINSTANITGIVSWFDGRVKTLHPVLFGGLLAPHDEAGLREAAEHKVIPFDLVAVDQYPFPNVIERAGLTEAQVIKRIDIGGDAMPRSGAKNHQYVVVISDLSTPTQTELVLEEIRANGRVSEHVSRFLAAETFRHSFVVNGEIADWMLRPDAEKINQFALPQLLGMAATGEKLRYGANPHQPARVYGLVTPSGIPFEPINLHMLKGLEGGLSVSNMLDADCNIGTVLEFEGPAVSVSKHASPIGVAESPTIEEALRFALDTDKTARYGCVLALNRPLTLPAAKELGATFVDLAIAPEVDEDALAHIKMHRPKMKVLQARLPKPGEPRFEAIYALGRIVLQEVDQKQLKPAELVRKTSHEATPEEMRDLQFAWKVARHARSNAAVLARGSKTVGVGSAFPVRADAVRYAAKIAGSDTEASVLALDGFAPFKDSIEVARNVGVRTVVQPGGSTRDQEVIETAEASGIAMYFTGWRIFRH